MIAPARLPNQKFNQNLKKIKPQMSLIAGVVNNSVFAPFLKIFFFKKTSLTDDHSDQSGKEEIKSCIQGNRLGGCSLERANSCKKQTELNIAALLLHIYLKFTLT